MSNFLEQAKRQRDCHRQQVSGVWSVNAQDFCNAAGVDYQKAVDYQVERESIDQDAYTEELLSEYELALGYLNDDQKQTVIDRVGSDLVNSDGYSAYFWDYVVNELEKKQWKA